MIPVLEARERLLAALEPTSSERVTLAQASGRVLASPVVAARTQPPADFSAMDGYALRASDCAEPGTRLEIVGESRAGKGFSGAVRAGEAVRIFTGAPVPDGADSVLIQEDAKIEGARLLVGDQPKKGANVRPAGRDFRQGETVLEAGLRLQPRHIALTAAADQALVSVHKRPLVALIATGDELTPPGVARGPDAIVDALTPALSAFIRRHGAELLPLGIIRDDAGALKDAAEQATAADLILTIGGASVGDYDLVRSSLEDTGFHLDFWKIAMRPGKPLIFGHYRGIPLIGLPGNPVSALVCALLFLGPALDRLSGAAPRLPLRLCGELASPLPANGAREAYLRARMVEGGDQRLRFEPSGDNDSSVLSSFAAADCLIIRPPHAPASPAGTAIEAIQLGDAWGA